MTTDVFLATKDGRIIRFNFSDIPLKSLVDKDGKQKSRKSIGVRAIRLNKGDEVVGITVNHLE